MFTGIVEGKGRVRETAGRGGGLVMTVETPFGLDGDRIGDSVSVNGVCLTITGIRNGAFTADVSAETLSRTNLGMIRPGDEVNIERAVRVGDRLGGHIVTGHVDGTGRIGKRERRGDNIYFEIEAGRGLMRHVVEKGSVAVDGVSLTVNGVSDGYFTLNIIPHTLKVTTLGAKRPGDEVNIETDILGKYVERLMGASKTPEGIDMGLLRRYGFA